MSKYTMHEEFVATWDEKLAVFILKILIASPVGIGLFYAIQLILS